MNRISPLFIALACAGCGASHSLTTSVPAAPHCQVLRLRPGAPSSTTPGATLRSRCTRDDLEQLLALVARLRLAARGREDICPLLAPEVRADLDRQRGRVSCTQAALRFGGGSVEPRVQLAQPVKGIVIFAEEGTSAVVGFAAPSPDAGIPGVNVSFARTPSGRWEITDVGYEF